ETCLRSNRVLPGVGALACATAGCPMLERRLPARAAEPYSEQGRWQILLRQQSLSGSQLATTVLDVDHAPGPLPSPPVDDARHGLPALGHESRGVSSDQPPPARHERGRLLLLSP